MTYTDAPARDADGRFLPGGPGGPGRPKGALNKLSSRVAHAIIRNFEANADDILDYMRIHHVAAYARLVTRLITKAEFVDDHHIEPLETDSAAQSLTMARRAMRASRSKPFVARCEFEAMHASMQPGGPSFYQALADRIETEMGPAERPPAKEDIDAVETRIADLMKRKGVSLRERELTERDTPRPSLRDRLQSGSAHAGFAGGSGDLWPEGGKISAEKPAGLARESAGAPLGAVRGGRL